MLPTILLSGFIFPIENMPRAYDWVSAVLPPRYFVVIIKSIMIKGTGFIYVWRETLILAVMTVVFMGLSIKNFRLRLQ
jgi:ABC-2 type transport system permease protein